MLENVVKNRSSGAYPQGNTCSRFRKASATWVMGPSATPSLRWPVRDSATAGNRGVVSTSPTARDKRKSPEQLCRSGPSLKRATGMSCGRGFLGP